VSILDIETDTVTAVAYPNSTKMLNQPVGHHHLLGGGVSIGFRGLIIST